MATYYFCCHGFALQQEFKIPSTLRASGGSALAAVLVPAAGVATGLRNSTLVLINCKHPAEIAAKVMSLQARR